MEDALPVVVDTDYPTASLPGGNSQPTEPLPQNAPSYDPADAELSLDAYPWVLGSNPSVFPDANEPPSDWLRELEELPGESNLNPVDIPLIHEVPTEPPPPVAPVSDSVRSALTRLRQPPLRSDISISDLVRSARVDPSHLAHLRHVQFTSAPDKVLHFDPTLSTPF